MFGLKKKESTETTTLVPEGAHKFQVHTMQDDINQINGTATKSATKNPATSDISKQSAKDSPFFTNAPTPQKSATDAQASPWLTDEPKKQPNQSPAANTPQNKAPAPSIDKEIKMPDNKGDGSIAKGVIPDNQLTPKTPTPTPTPPPSLKNMPADLPQAKAAPAEVNVPTSPLDTLEKPKAPTAEIPKPTEKSPVNDIEAEMSSFTKNKKGNDGATAEKITTFSPLTQTPSEMFQDMGGPAKEEGKTKKTKKKKKGGFKKLLKILITLLLLALLVIGGYFGYKYIQEQGLVNLEDLPGSDLINTSQDQDQDQDQDLADQDEPAEEEPVAPDKKYAAEFPNYIELTDDTGGSAEFSQKMSEIARNLPSQNLTAPISFLITDPDGTPLTFQAFAELTNMTLPPAVLDQAGNAFEIYAYENLGDVRFGIGFEYLDRQQMNNALSDNEVVLPQAFTPLYNDLEVTTPTAFGDNVYGNYPVRFSNLRPDESLSIDYTVADKVYVGTSMMSQRAILDKYATDEVR